MNYLELSAATTSLGMLAVAGWSLYSGFKDKQAEPAGIGLLFGMTIIPSAALFGFWASKESWLPAFFIVAAAGAILYLLRKKRGGIGNKP
jgi:hypothetical protein